MYQGRQHSGQFQIIAFDPSVFGGADPDDNARRTEALFTGIVGQGASYRHNDDLKLVSAVSTTA
jgi:hypothetical protein